MSEQAETSAETGTPGERREGCETVPPTISTTACSPDVLIEDLEASPAGCRELDRQVWLVTGGWAGVDAPPPFTTSLDAALALADRAVAVEEDEPVFWEIGFNAVIAGERQYCAQMYPPWDGPADYYGHARSPALAVCAAVIKAVAANSVGTERSGVNPLTNPDNG